MTASPPYGRVLTAALGPAQRVFARLNTVTTAPLIRCGAGGLLATPLAGSLLLLRVPGRCSGIVRETPLCYALDAGRILVVAGFGPRTQWYRNALAAGEVEVILPGAALTGRANAVTVESEQVQAMRALARLAPGHERWQQSLTSCRCWQQSFMLPPLAYEYVDRHLRPPADDDAPDVGLPARLAECPLTGVTWLAVLGPDDRATVLLRGPVHTPQPSEAEQVPEVGTAGYL